MLRYNYKGAMAVYPSHPSKDGKTTHRSFRSHQMPPAPSPGSSLSNHFSARPRASFLRSSSSEDDCYIVIYLHSAAVSEHEKHIIFRSARTSCTTSDPRGWLAGWLAGWTRAKNLDQLYSYINHHRTTTNLSDIVWCMSGGV